MPADDIETLLDYETPLEKMFAHLFAAAFVAIYTPGNATFVDDAWKTANPDLAQYIFVSTEEFQKQRPRLELIVNAGQATGHLTTNLGDAFDNQRCDAFAGTVMLNCITDTNLSRHRLYRARIRKIMGDQFPSTYMPYHDINKCMENGTSLAYSQETGLLKSTINFDLHFNIKPDAWPS